jgi:hypothetical protein
VNETERAEFLTSKNEWVAIFRAMGVEETVDYSHNPPNAQRVLCICRGGNTRSVATAFLLKYKYKRDAVCASFEKNSEDLLFLLANWASVIMVFEEAHYHDAVLQLNPYAEKIVLVDLTGAARLRSYPFEINFLKQVDSKLKELGYDGW